MWEKWVWLLCSSGASALSLVRAWDWRTGVWFDGAEPWINLRCVLPWTEGESELVPVFVVNKWMCVCVWNVQRARLNSDVSTFHLFLKGSSNIWHMHTDRYRLLPDLSSMVLHYSFSCTFQREGLSQGRLFDLPCVIRGCAENTSIRTICSFAIKHFGILLSLEVDISYNTDKYVI